MKYYTIFLGEEPWSNTIDDMNTMAIWAEGGMFWPTKEQAEACMKNLQHPAYELEAEDKKFTIKEFTL